MARRLLRILLFAGLSVLLVDPAFGGFVYFLENTGTNQGMLRRIRMDGSGREDLLPVYEGRYLDIDPVEGKIYLSNHGARVIQRVNLDGSGLERRTGASSPTGVAVDAVNRRLYWTDDYDKAVFRGSLNGVDRQTLFIFPGRTDSVFTDIELDVEGGKMYWNDIRQNKIFRANLDGSGFETLRDYQYGAPVGLALDLRAGKIYWQESNYILRANLDGSGLETVLQSPAGSPWDIEIDVEAGKIYWSSFLTGIFRANLDGSNIQQIYTTSASVRGIALQTSPKIYWLENTGTSVGKLRSADIDGGGVEDLLDVFEGRYLDVDPVEAKIYLSNHGARAIQRVNLDGSGLERRTGASSPTGVAIDAVNRRLYWTDDFDKAVFRGSLNGVDRQTLFIFPGRTDSIFTDVELDVAGGKVYWNDVRQNKVFRANLDGSSFQTVRNHTYGAPVGLALDLRAGKIYWQESNYILRANLDGTDMQTVLMAPAGSPYDIEIDVEAGKIYWSSFLTGIFRANLDGSDIEQIYSTANSVRGIALNPPRTDTDQDGVTDREENGAPNGGDGNADGIADSAQQSVASVRNAIDGRYVTLVADPTVKIRNLTATSNLSGGTPPEGYAFPVGFLKFALSGLPPGGSTHLTLILPPGVGVDTYFKYGAPSGGSTPEFFEFVYDGTTGAQTSSGSVQLWFVDGGRGDLDGDSENGSVSDPGGPAIRVNRPPVANCQDVSVEADQECRADAATDSGSSDPDGDPIELRQEPPGPYGIGSHPVVLTVTDDKGASSSCSAQVLVLDTTAPIPVEDPLAAVEGECSAAIDEAPLAEDNCSATVTGTTDDPRDYSEQGEFVVHWKYKDGAGNTKEQDQTVRVRDTISPSIQSIAASPSVLWPPNNQLVAVSIEVDATDNCGHPVSCEISGVESDEPGVLEANHQDWQITGALTLKLRAERAGSGNGRTYSIQVSCVDGVGNSSLADTQVVVPVSRR